MRSYPVFQPVFFGFGLEGAACRGPRAAVGRVRRYCRYLVARYGARPAVYLVGGDGTGREPQVAAGGEEVERWDAYRQPTGIDYRPHIVANAHHGRQWLDLQWCQTGHTGEHIPERVAEYVAQSAREGGGQRRADLRAHRQRGLAEGWWQGHEAWSNFVHGMFGVVYGAASMWQWAQQSGQPGQSDFFTVPAQAGGKRSITKAQPRRPCRPHSSQACRSPTCSRTGKLRWAVGACWSREAFIGYTWDGGELRVFGEQVPLRYLVVDPRTGEVVVAEGVRSSHYTGAHSDVGEGPRVCLA